SGAPFAQLLIAQGFQFGVQSFLKPERAGSKHLEGLVAAMVARTLSCAAPKHDGLIFGTTLFGSYMCLFGSYACASGRLRSTTGRAGRCGSWRRHGLRQLLFPFALQLSCIAGPRAAALAGRV